MIINIAGTNGSGKTYVVRAMLERAKLIQVIPGNKLWKEFGRLVELAPGRTIFVLGRYEDKWDTGGADTIKDVELIYRLVFEHVSKGEDVVYEGAMAMNHMRGCDMVGKMVRANIPVHVLLLQTTLDECKAGINARRSRRGDPPFNRDWKWIEGNTVRAKNYAFKVKEVGATIHKVTRTEAPIKLIELLRSQHDLQPARQVSDGDTRR